MAAELNLSTGSRGGSPNEAITFAEASPLLREVEEAHAQLQAAFKDSAAKAANGDIDLMERVRRLEASFNAVAQSHKATVQQD